MGDLRWVTVAIELVVLYCHCCIICLGNVLSDSKPWLSGTFSVLHVLCSLHEMKIGVVRSPCGLWFPAHALNDGSNKETYLMCCSNVSPGASFWG